MGWDLEAGCGCGTELMNLEHLFLNCPLLSEGRPGFFGFLEGRFLDLPPDQFDYRELVFDPDPCVVSKLGRFLNTVILLYEFSGLWLERAAPSAWSPVLPCFFAASSGWTDHLGHLSFRWDWLQTPATYCPLIRFLADACHLLCFSHCADHILERYYYTMIWLFAVLQAATNKKKKKLDLMIVDGRARIVRPRAFAFYVTYVSSISLLLLIFYFYSSLIILFLLISYSYFPLKANRFGINFLNFYNTLRPTRYLFSLNSDFIFLKIFFRTGFPMTYETTYFYFYQIQHNFDIKIKHFPKLNKQ